MYKIAVSGINATDNPGPGLAVAKSLKQSRQKIRTIGLSYDVNDPGHYVREYLDSSYVLPFPTKGWEGIKERLIEIKEREGLDIIIPCLDAELPLYIQYADELASLGIRTFLPDKELFTLRNKENLTEVAERISIDHPQTRPVYTPAQLNMAIEDLGLPVMVKGPYYKAGKASTHAEAHYYYETISAEWGFPILVQSMAQGEELNVIGLGDGHGDHLGLVAIKKTTITSLGKIWSGMTIKHEGMLASAAAFVRKYKWRGPFELECIVSNDKINLIEINPRFPAWAYFAAGVGINLPERLVMSLVDENNPRLAEYKGDIGYPPGKLFMRYTDEKVVDINVFQNLITNGFNLNSNVKRSPGR